MEELEKKAIGKRLRTFAEDNYESLAEFGREFGKDRTFFTPYFNGSSVPGGEILKRLAELGCDLNWLYTGIRLNEGMEKIKKKLEEENKDLKQVNYTLLDQATKLSKVAEAMDKKYGIRKK